MFQHTLDRARGIVGEDHVISVVGPGHDQFLNGSKASFPPGKLIEQPRNLGTATGLFLAALYIFHYDPEATVFILPSDHFLYPEKRFLQIALEACALAERFEKTIILLAASPNRAETDYGWIEPDRTEKSVFRNNGNRKLRAVRGFHEKPDKLSAEKYFKSYYFWNTMIMAVKAKSLWALGRKVLPKTIGRFETLRWVLNGICNGFVEKEREAMVLSDIYRAGESVDFSRDFLMRAVRYCAVQVMDGVQWCDWGRPERISQTLKNIKKKEAAFSFS